MVNARELENLIIAARARGARIDVRRDRNDLVLEVTVSNGFGGVGTQPMSAISAAEKLRIALNDDDKPAPRRAG